MVSFDPVWPLPSNFLPLGEDDEGRVCFSGISYGLGYDSTGLLMKLTCLWMDIGLLVLDFSLSCHETSGVRVDRVDGGHCRHWHFGGPFVACAGSFQSGI